MARNKAGQVAASAPQQKPAPGIILPGTTIGGEVGTFNADFLIWNRDMTESCSLNGLVDTGASYTMIPASALEELGIERDRVRTFSLADGSKQDFAIGWAQMELQGETSPAPVIFGPETGKILLGAMALEAFGLAADAKNRRLIPAELTI